MTVDYARFFERTTTYFPLAVLKRLSSNDHVSIPLEFMPVFLRAISEFEHDAAFTLATHDDTFANKDFIRKHKSNIYYFDHTRDMSIYEEMRKYFPNATVYSIIYDIIASQTMHTRYDRPPAPPSGGIRANYFILCPPRSGSYFLCDLLTKAGAGEPDEHLRPDNCYIATFPDFNSERFLDAMMNYGTKSGVFGTKLIYTFFRQVFDLRSQDKIKRCADMFNKREFSAIRLMRQDKTAQAVSKYVADKTRLYKVTDKSALSSELPPYVAQEMLAAYDIVCQEEEAVSRFIRLINKSEVVTYEDLDADPKAITRNLMDFLAIKPRDGADLSGSSLLKQRSQLSHEYAQRLNEDLLKRGGQ